MIDANLDQLSEPDVRHSAQVLPGEFSRFAETLPCVLSLLRSATDLPGWFEGVVELEANFVSSGHHSGLFECCAGGSRNGEGAT